MKFVAAALLVAGVVGCKADPSSGGGAPPAASVSPETGPPVVATFMDLREESDTVMPVLPCHEQMVAVVKGAATVAEEELVPGDVLVARGMPAITAKGDASVLAVTIRQPACDAAAYKRVSHAEAAPEVTFMHGAMHARLDVDSTVSPAAYFGRLSGTAAVAEHAHAGTWEVLCTLLARGTFTLNGQPRRLGSRECVTVPPDTKHSWQPDEGNQLVALQMYWPPGPEQRFKKLAADEAAGGDH